MGKLITKPEAIKIAKTNNIDKAVKITSRNTNLIKQNLQRLNQISEIIKEELTDGVDYGVIPGTSQAVLLKPGANKLALLYGLRQKYKVIDKIQDYDKGIILYAYECILVDGNNTEISQGHGLCSSQEKSKKKEIATDIENTLMKMAKKRALVDAVVSIAVLSKIFTQDMEEDSILSTKNKDLSKQDKLELYTLTFSHYIEAEELFKSKKTITKDERNEFKELIKVFLREYIFKELKIQASNFLAFKKEERDLFLNHINDINNYKKDIQKIKELKNE